MKKSQEFFCTECGETFAKWQGQCPNCQEWNTLKEWKEPKLSSKSSQKISGKNLTHDSGNFPENLLSRDRISTTIEEVDRVLGGGFFPGSFVLFGGSPGVGKSTLALQMFLSITEAMYFSGEESREQVLHRAERLQKKSKKIPEISADRVFSTHSLEDIIATITQQKPPVAIIDSIQMVGLEQTVFGSIAQVKENAEILLKLAKSTGTTIVIIGHVTKNDEIAGPRVLEHVVDTVLRLEGERNSEVRILRSPKNRFGSTLEVGVFEMRESGLTELKNPSEFFLNERAENSSGSAITVVREGSRNFLLEIQALTLKTNFGQPRRTSHGIDLSKFHLLLAVVSKFTPFGCGDYDAYLNIVGGIKVKEPATDLAIVAAILGSRLEKEIAADTIVLGEVGLSGEVRSVAQIESRLREAEKLGFKKAVVPKNSGKNISLSSLKITEVKTVFELVKVLFEK